MLRFVREPMATLCQLVTLSQFEDKSLNEALDNTHDLELVTLVKQVTVTDLKGKPTTNF